MLACIVVAKGFSTTDMQVENNDAFSVTATYAWKNDSCCGKFRFVLNVTGYNADPQEIVSSGIIDCPSSNEVPVVISKTGLHPFRQYTAWLKQQTVNDSDSTQVLFETVWIMKTVWTIQAAPPTPKLTNYRSFDVTNSTARFEWDFNEDECYGSNTNFTMKLIPLNSQFSTENVTSETYFDCNFTNHKINVGISNLVANQNYTVSISAQNAVGKSAATTIESLQTAPISIFVSRKTNLAFTRSVSLIAPVPADVTKYLDKIKNVNEDCYKNDKTGKLAFTFNPSYFFNETFSGEIYGFKIYMLRADGTSPGKLTITLQRFKFCRQDPVYCFHL